MERERNGSSRVDRLARVQMSKTRGRKWGSGERGARLGRRLLEEGEGPDGWDPPSGEREEGRRGLPAGPWPKRGEGRRGPRGTRLGQIEGEEKYSYIFFKQIFKAHFQMEFEFKTRLLKTTHHKNRMLLHVCIKTCF